MLNSSLKMSGYSIVFGQSYATREKIVFKISGYSIAFGQSYATREKISYSRCQGIRQPSGSPTPQERKYHFQDFRVLDSLRAVLCLKREMSSKVPPNTGVRPCPTMFDQVEHWLNFGRTWPNIAEHGRTWSNMAKYQCWGGPKQLKFQKNEYKHACT